MNILSIILQLYYVDYDYVIFQMNIMFVGSRVSGKASPDFQSLVEGLLNKKPLER